MNKNIYLTEKKNERTLLVFLLTLVFALTLTTVAYATQGGDSFEPRPPKQIIIVTGVAGGTSFIQGEALSSIFRKNGVPSTAEPGGDAGNLLTLNAGKAEIGVSTTGMPKPASEAIFPFTEKVTNIAGLANLGDCFVHIIVLQNKGINSVADLKGKPFASQPMNSGSRLSFMEVLSVFGLTEDDLDIRRGGQSDGAQLMKDEHVVGHTATTTAPSGTFIELFQTKPVKMLPLKEVDVLRIAQANSGMRRMILPAGTYPNQDEDVLGVGVDRMWVIRKDMPDEEVYWITKTFIENLDDFKQAHAAMAGLTVEKMADMVGIEIHPGAKRYYDEVLGSNK